MTAQGAVRIWWDTAVQAYRVATPYSQQFVDALKILMPSSERAWDPTQRIWTVTEKYFIAVKDLSEKFFKTTAAVITRQQAEKASMPPRTQAAPVDSIIAEFFKLLPFESAQKAYRDAAMQLHPDRGGSMEKMSALNAAWQRLQKELYNRS